MNINHRPFLSVIMALALSFGLFSPQVLAATATASVSKNQVTKDEVFQLRVTIDQKVSSDELDLSVLENNFYLGRPSFGTSMNIVNGKRSVRSEWTVSIAPLNLGTLTIPSFTIDSAKTHPINIKVSIDKSAPKQSDMAEFNLKLDQQQLYPSQSSQLDVKLIIKADPRRLQNPKITPPNADGVDVTPIGESKQYQAVYEGVEVTVVEQSFRITATSPGSFQLNGPKLTGAVIYGDRYSNATKLIQLDTKVKTFDIEVLPIPASYQGTWLPTPKFVLGQTWTTGDGSKLDHLTTDYEAKVGDSITRTITMHAEGLTEQQLPNLAIDYPNSVRVYEEKPQFTQTETGQPIVIFKQVIIPKQAGTISLPEVKQSWWNTTEKRQQSSQVSGLTLTVEEGEQAAAPLPAISQPATSAEVVTIKDAGHWPLLTTVFASLWAASSILAWWFWRKTKLAPSKNEEPISAEQLDATQALIAAINAKDGMKVQACYTNWLALSSAGNTELKAQATEEVAQLNRSLYAKDAKDTVESWNPVALRKLVKMKQSDIKTQDSPLAPL